MTDFVFINPSPNLELVAKNLRSFGRSVDIIYSKDFVSTRPASFWAFFGDEYMRLGDGTLSSDTLNEICKIKKPLFSGFRGKSLKALIQKDVPDVVSATFQDSVLLTSAFWKNPTKEIKRSEYSISDIVSRYSNSSIITAYIPFGGGKRTISYWRTDYDAAEALGNDYFFFFDDDTRHELYFQDKHLVCISGSKHKLEWLKKINPTFGKFSFERVRTENFMTNTQPWVQKVSSKVFLINDYSWHGVSAQLPDSWVKTLGAFLLSDKK
jgi:hypothetical protein